VGKAIQSAEGRMIFQRASEKFVTKKSIEGKYEGVALADAQVKAGTDILLRADENQAVFGATPELQEQAITRGLARIQNLTSRRILSGTEANARVNTFLTHVREGQLKRAAGNPELRGQVIDDLVNGRETTLSPTRQLELADSMMREQEAIQTKLDAKLAAEAEAARKADVDALDAKADRGQLTDSELQQARTDRRAMGEDFRRLAEKVRKGAAAGGRTNDEVYNRLELDLKENPFSHSAREIRRIQEEGNLAATGPRSASTLIDLIPDPEKAAGIAAAKDITQKPLFKQGLHEIRVLRGGKGALESLTSEVATRLDNAEREYHDIARSGKFTDDQLPEVARKIVERVRAQTPLQMGDPEAVQLLRYQTPADLMAAKKAGIIPDAEFNRQFKLMQRLGILQGPKKDVPGAATLPKKAPSGGR
jgi:hypothetical protein